MHSPQIRIRRRHGSALPALLTSLALLATVYVRARYAAAAEPTAAVDAIFEFYPERDQILVKRMMLTGRPDAAGLEFLGVSTEPQDMTRFHSSTWWKEYSTPELRAEWHALGEPGRYDLWLIDQK